MLVFLGAEIFAPSAVIVLIASKVSKFFIVALYIHIFVQIAHLLEVKFFDIKVIILERITRSRNCIQSIV